MEDFSEPVHKKWAYFGNIIEVKCELCSIIKVDIGFFYYKRQLECHSTNVSIAATFAHANSPLQHASKRAAGLEVSTLERLQFSEDTTSSSSK